MPDGDLSGTRRGHLPLSRTEPSTRLDTRFRRVTRRPRARPDRTPSTARCWCCSPELRDAEGGTHVFLDGSGKAQEIALGRTDAIQRRLVGGQRHVTLADYPSSGILTRAAHWRGRPSCCIQRMAGIDRAKVIELARALQEPDSRSEATEALRGLVDAIVLLPDQAGLARAPEGVWRRRSVSARRGCRFRASAERVRAGTPSWRS
jgi:hypothetical protein